MRHFQSLNLIFLFSYSFIHYQIIFIDHLTVCLYLPFWKDILYIFLIFIQILLECFYFIILIQESLIIFYLIHFPFFIFHHLIN